MGGIIGTLPALEIARIVIEIEQLADWVFAELSLCESLSIDIPLWIASNLLDDVLITLSMDMTTIPLILEDMSKAGLKLSEITTLVFENRSIITEEQGDYISTRLHDIRDRITLTMGQILNTEAGMKIASVGIELDQLADRLIEDYDLFVALSIDQKLWCSREFLDLALIDLSMDVINATECELRIAINKLEDAKTHVIFLENEGHITNDDVVSINAEIDVIIGSIEELLSHSDSEGIVENPSETNLHGETTDSGNQEEDTSSSCPSSEDPNTDVPTH
jgi:hypothetical protein